MDIFDTISEKASFFYTIEQPSGDMIIRSKHEETVIQKEDKYSNIIHETISTNGLLGGPHEISNDGGKVNWEPIDNEAKDNKYRWKIRYKYGLKKDKPISYEHIYTVPNVFSFSREEKKCDIIAKEKNRNKYDIKNEELKEFISIDTKNQAYQNLFLQIQFPGDLEIPEVRVIVKEKLEKNGFRKNNAEEKYCNHRLSHFKESNTVILFVDNALIDHEYVIEWDLPITKSNNKLTEPEDVIEGLLDLRTNSNIPKPYELLKTLRHDILQYINSIKPKRGKNHDEQDMFELNILVFNKELCKYQYAVKFCTKGMYYNTTEGDIVHGHHTVGVAAKHKAPAWIIPIDNKKIEDRHIVKKTCKLFPSGNLYAMIAIPLFFPINSKNLIGVVELASCSKDTVLRYLKDRNNNEKTAANMSLLQDLLHGDFLKGLCRTSTGCSESTDSCTKCIRGT
ncbi:hypothetical protein MBAV_000468 [Candidatus Magnetobacterium bavaricum]|uniref:Uncharacterized protein n=1 Tax=Candidatus Magnetobacterium bavaricum TaxID=29290 RepID=A0A0F3H345_9BACT|nr:hypothetical protein MBAV_000468 [Candidatus Magnetobacterium bavaricum]